MNPPKSDVAIELYSSQLEEKLLNLGPIKHKYNNLTRKERKALYDLRNDNSIIIKEADKASVKVIWDKENYLKVAIHESQFADRIYLFADRFKHFL